MKNEALTELSKDDAALSVPAADFPFPKFIACHSCGTQRRVIRREICEMPEGLAGVVWAKCRKCRHTFVRFVGEKAPAARLMKKWLGIQDD